MNAKVKHKKLMLVSCFVIKDKDFLKIFYKTDFECAVCETSNGQKCTQRKIQKGYLHSLVELIQTGNVMTNKPKNQQTKKWQFNNKQINKNHNQTTNSSNK